LLLRVAADQRWIWAFPAEAALQGNGLLPASGVIGVTAALIALDPLWTPYLQQPAFQDAPAIRGITRILSGRNMASVIYATPSSLYIGGFICRNAYAWRTGLMAGEAALNAEIVAILMKHVDRRMRPIEVGPDGDFTRTWFRTKNRDIDGAGCFPSGHTAAAFAVATVLAERYPRIWRGRHWAGWAAFGMAGIIGASRVLSRAHFVSDVFFGATLGYSISHFVVMRRELPPGPPLA
jgi:membrane-associated phospholipid phosphatase